MESGLRRHSTADGVLIRGDGVAACCCAYLLRQAGIPALIERSTRTQPPAVLLSEASIALLADVFGRKELFRDLPRIRSRVVAWGQEAAVVTLRHSAVVVSERVLLDALRPEEEDGQRPSSVKCSIIASRTLPDGCVEQRFGPRVALTFAVTLRKGVDAGCWAEATVDGWLFLSGAGMGEAGFSRWEGLIPREVAWSQRRSRT
jgi:hypothetical protein